MSVNPWMLSSYGSYAVILFSSQKKKKRKMRFRLLIYPEEATVSIPCKSIF